MASLTGSNGGVNVDGNGISGSGSGGNVEPHLTVHKEVVLGTSVNRKVETWQGEYDKLLEMAKAYELGKYVSDDKDLPAGTSDTDASGTGYGYAYVSDVKLTRENGNAGRLVVTFTQNRARAFVSVDFTEVQRPIRNWKADAGGEGSQQGGDDAPDLAKIREWEAKKESNYSEYADFKGLSGNTKKLAEMIFKGIETFSVYAPVVTVTLTTFSFPQVDLYRIGKKFDEPKIPYGWKEIHDTSMESIVQRFVKENSDNGYTWVLGSSKVTHTANGTYQWVLQYQACDSVEEVLFE